ncbi:MAG: phospholipase D family protein [Deltaproteobacteria bacterium]|nr:phospholipase D family protein [Deltaproteobacteria bacterium]
MELNIVTSATGEMEEQVRDAIGNAQEVWVISAYVSLTGFEIIEDQIKKSLRKGGNITLLFGIDQSNISSKELYDRVSVYVEKWPKNISVWVCFQKTNYLMHAKVYAGFGRDDGQDHLLIGSTNLTERAFKSNTEIAIRAVGNLGNLRRDIHDIFESLKPACHKLDKENIKDLSKFLIEKSSAKIELTEEQLEDQKRRRDEVKEKFNKLTEKIKPPDPETIKAYKNRPQDFVMDLISEGVFLSYDFDMEKTNAKIKSDYLYRAGMLTKEAKRKIGIAQKRNKGSSYSVPMLPEDVQKKLKSISLKISNAFGTSGIETAFGYWVPNSNVQDLNERISECESELVGILTESERRVSIHINKSRKELDSTVKKVVYDLAKDGLSSPDKWKTRKFNWDQAIIRSNYKKGAPWNNKTELYKRALKSISEVLYEDVRSQLNKSYALAQIRTLSSKIIYLSEPQGEENMRIYISDLVWAVVGYRFKGLKRKTGPVRYLVERSRGQTTEEDLVKYVEASCSVDDESFISLEKLVETFISWFGKPPYFSPESLNTIAAEEEQEDEVDDDEDGGNDDEDDESDCD